MKRLMIKYLAVCLVIVSASTVFWAGCGYLWLRSLLLDQFSAASAPVVSSLDGLITEKANRSRITDTLKVLARQPDIIMSAVTHAQGQLVYARGPQKRDRIIWPFYLEYPVVQGGLTAGYLKIWPAPEAVFRDLTEGRHPFTMAAGVIFWAMTILILITLALYRMVLRPVAALDAFVTALENGRPASSPADLSGAGIAEWRALFQRVARWHDKYIDANSTIDMLFSVSQTLTSRLAINEIFTLLMEIIQKKFEGVKCSASMYEEDGTFSMRAHRGFTVDFLHHIKERAEDSSRSGAFRNHEAVIVNDAADRTPVADPEILEQEGVASFAHIPLMADAHCVGFMLVASAEKNYFTPARVTTLVTLTKYLSIALGNARLYERVQELNRRLETEVSITTGELIQTNSRLIQKVREMKTLYDISTVAANRTTLDEILELAVDKVTELLTAESAGLSLYEETSGELVPCLPFFGSRDRDLNRLRVKLDDAPVMESVFREGSPCFLNSGAQIAKELPRFAAELSPSSLALIPLRSGSVSIGVLGVANKLNGAFTQDDLRILNLIGDRIASIIENIRLYQELECRVRDLTALSESLAEAKQKQEDLNRVKNDFISVVSHELRTPITSVKACVKMILQKDVGELNAEQTRFLQIADDSINRMILLIADLVDMSKIESGEMRLDIAPAEALDIVKTSCAGIEPLVMQKQLTLEYTVPPAFPQIMVDRSRFIQVFDNLITNAVKYTQPGGRIRITAEDKGDLILFCVSDTGKGIEAGNEQRIFEKFYQVHSETTHHRSGTGLGLAIVKSIIDMHGGKIWVESEQGKGSRFLFIIPRARTEMGGRRGFDNRLTN